MNAPRWFYAVIAGCVVVLTLAVAAAVALRAPMGRYQLAGADWAGGAVLDTQTGVVCTLSNPAICFDAKGRKK